MRKKWLSGIAVLAACGFILVASRPTFSRYFIRGDADQTRRLDIRDPVRILRFLFGGVPEAYRRIPCLDVADADDDGHVAINDPIYLLNHLFRGGPEPPRPYPDWGADPTPDLLECSPWTTFTGMEVDGDANFFVIDRSGSMQDSGELPRIKNELSRLLPWLPEGSDFAVVFFAEEALSFPEEGLPAVAGEDSLLAALRFVDEVPWGRGSCLVRGLRVVLEFANLSPAARKTVWISSDIGVLRGIGVVRIDIGREGVSLQQVLDELGVANRRC